MAAIYSDIFSRKFILLCLGTFFFFASFNMVIPELYDHLTSLGGEDYKGLVIPLFASAALLSRPVSGWIADHIGRIPVILFGGLICVLCSSLYPFIGTIWGFFLLRILHGLSTGFSPTGVAAYISDIVNLKNRGAAMGFYGFFTSAGMASGAAIASELTMRFSIDVMFYTSAAFGLISSAVALGMTETLPVEKRKKLSQFKLSFHDIYEPRVLAPSIIMACLLFAFGLVLTIIPDFSTHLGIANKGIFFSILMITSFFIRVFAGRLSDIYGRERILRWGIIVLVLSMIVTGLATTKEIFYLGAALYGLSVGINSPTLFAWTVDRSDDNHRGRAMSTLYMFLEIGIIAGGFAAGLLYNNDPSNFRLLFWIAAAIAFVGLLFSVFRKRIFKQPKFKQPNMKF